jgi:hypothetical protein
MVTVDPTQTASGQIEQLVDRLKSCFIDELEEISSDAGARPLRLFDVWRQVSLRRIVDLAESAEAFFLQGRLLPGCTLTRSAVETVAIQYAVWKKLGALTDASDYRGIHSLMMSVVFGRRDKGGDWPNKSMNVLTAIDHLDKQFPGFRSEYDRLSEYVHPGLAGGYGVYVRTEGERLRSYFGQNPLRLEMDPWGRSELERALLVAVTFNELLNEIRPRVQALVRQHG